MIYVLLLVAWFHDGSAGTASKAFPDPVSCETAAKNMLQYVQNDGEVVSAAAQCVPVSNPATEQKA